MTHQNWPVPNFGIGETEAPLRYLETALPLLCKRVGISGTCRQRFIEAGLASARSVVPMMAPEKLALGMVEPTPEARTFWNLAGDAFLKKEESTVTGLEHLRTAMCYQEQGWNVVVVQNHRSGADMLVMETLIRRNLGKDICADWSYMSGHAVNLFLIPLMFSAGMRRVQIFSAKYLSTGLPNMTAEKMHLQNQRALLALRRHTQKRVNGKGNVILYYPEGGRGDGALKMGEPKTSCLPRVIARNGSKLLILPTFVGNTEALLPHARGTNEFNEILEHMQRGSASLTIGAPVCWEAIRDNNTGFEQSTSAWNQRICNTLLALVARLGPKKEAGPYDSESAGVWSLIAPLLNEGAL